MRRGSLRKAYRHGLIEPVAKHLDRREVDTHPGSRTARKVKAVQQTGPRVFRLRWVDSDTVEVREEIQHGQT